MRISSLTLSAVTLAAVSVLTGCGHTEASDPRNEPLLVQVATVRSNAESQRAFTGVIATRVQSDIGFRVSGKIIERLVDVGQRVHKGQPLMRLDPTDLALGVSALQGTVDTARAASTKADADMARLDGLVKLGAVSAQDYDLAVQAASSAKAQLSAAQAQLNISKNADQYGVLKAESDGIIVSRIADVGQVVSAGQPVLGLAADGPVEAAVSLPETVRPKIGSKAEAYLYGSDGQVIPAQLRELSQAADPITRTYAARYVLSAGADEVPLGSTVVVRIAGGSKGDETIVPIGALYDAGKGTGVWVVGGKEPKVSFHAVKVARTGQESAYLSDGLQAGEKVVALGAPQLHNDQVVRIAETAAGMAK
jgi:RND family efflux transporter MFP subunit